MMRGLLPDSAIIGTAKRAKRLGKGKPRRRAYGTFLDDLDEFAALVQRNVEREKREKARRKAG